MGQKNSKSEKNFGSEKICEKNFGSERILTLRNLGPKKFGVQNFFRAKKIADEIILGHTRILCLKNNLCLKIFVEKDFGTEKKVGSEKILSSKHLFGPMKLLVQKCGP